MMFAHFFVNFVYTKKLTQKMYTKIRKELDLLGMSEKKFSVPGDIFSPGGQRNTIQVAMCEG